MATPISSKSARRWGDFDQDAKITRTVSRDATGKPVVSYTIDHKASIEQNRGEGWEILKKAVLPDKTARVAKIIATNGSSRPEHEVTFFGKALGWALGAPFGLALDALELVLYPLAALKDLVIDRAAHWIASKRRGS